MELNPEELLLKTKLLDNFHSALRKHNLTNQAELLHLFKELQEKTIDAEDLESVIAEKEIKLEEVEKTGNKIAKELSERRKKISKTVEKSIKELLNELKFEDASVLFDFQEMKFSSRGIDDVTLFFSPNKGIEPQVIEKSASGGELSRLMLAIQYLLSQKKKLPTIIFDEIDTGVSGEVAQKIGIHLKKLGERMQLLAITHLPQVASKGSHHILVEKSDKDETTKTSLKILSEEDRVYEIAKLMSGSSINEAALLNAKNLMNEQ